jgi:hypothetical protein
MMYSFVGPEAPGSKPRSKCNVAARAHSVAEITMRDAERPDLQGLLQYRAHEVFHYVSFFSARETERELNYQNEAGMNCVNIVVARVATRARSFRIENRRCARSRNSVSFR